MARTVLRWILIALALAIAGPILAWLCRPIRAVDGGLTATVLVNGAVGPAILRSVLALTIVLLFGAGVSRLMGWRLGAFVAGCALAWPAWEHAGVAQLIRTMDDPGVMTMLAIEGGLLVGAVTAIAFTIHWADPGIDHRSDALRGVVPGIGGLIASALAAATLASIVVMLVAQSELRAQAFAAAVFGAISLRTRGIYFIMITLAFAQMIYFLGVGVETYGGDALEQVQAHLRWARENAL